MKKLALALALGLATCTTVPEEYREEFDRISMNYKINEHDCDDMAQEFRDYLMEQGVRPADIKLVQAYRLTDKKIPLGHMWLEYKIDDRWYVFDPAGKIYGGDREDMLDNGYVVTNELHGLMLFLDSGGYRMFGDRYEKDKWKRTVIK
jgi:hypothetical protein